MTGPSDDPYGQYPPASGQYPAQPPAHPLSQPYYGAPQGGGFGLEPGSGLPYSDKSKVVAGLLQILPGFFLALGGIGRLYAGNTGLGVAQLVCTVVGWVSFWCGFLLVFPFFVSGLIWLWFVIDGVVMLAGRPVDGSGRPLRS